MKFFDQRDFYNQVDKCRNYEDQYPLNWAGVGLWKKKKLHIDSELQKTINQGDHNMIFVELICKNLEKVGSVWEGDIFSTEKSVTQGDKTICAIYQQKEDNGPVMGSKVPLNQKINNQICQRNTSDISGKHEGFFAEIENQKNQNSQNYISDQPFIKNRHVLIGSKQWTKKNQTVKSSNAINAIHEIDGIDYPQSDKI